MKRKAIWWTVGFSFIIITILGTIAFWTVKVDPFFHYHKPDTEAYYYSLDNQRSQNDGIVKHFDYQGIITGTSMTECFKTTQAEELWGGRFVKVPFEGGSFKEINDNLTVALKHNPQIRIIIRGLDMDYFLDDKDRMRTELGDYPAYLYDDNVLNDAEYVFNRDVFFSRVWPMARANEQAGYKGGITTFDNYSDWMSDSRFGKNAVYPEGFIYKDSENTVELLESDRKRILENVQQNITSLTDAYPDVTFYCFFTPYGGRWWHGLKVKGEISRQIQAEQIVIEEILKHKNIKLFSFNNLTNIITDLNNYKDAWHYGEWINSLVLDYMHDGICQLTEENYQSYLDEEKAFYSSFDYNQMDEQEDYDNDYQAEVIIGQTNDKSNEAQNATSLPEDINDLTETEISLDALSIQLSHATLVENQFNGKPGVICQGALQRGSQYAEMTFEEYLRDIEYIGFKVEIEDISSVKYISFYGKKYRNHGQPTVYVYDNEGKVIAQCSGGYQFIDRKWYRYIIDVSDAKGTASIVFNGGYVDDSGSPYSLYAFSNVTMYSESTV